MEEGPHQSETPKTHTLAWAFDRYRNSSAWSGLSHATRRQRENIYRAVIETAGDAPLREITAATIRGGRERRSEKPHAANNFLKAMRGFFGWAVDTGLVRADPTKGVKLLAGTIRTVLEFLHAGDVLTVTRIDRLARSIGDLQDIVRAVRARGAVLKATEQSIDTGTAAAKCFLDMLGVFAEFETNLRRERQLEGIAKAKAAGVYKGRPPSIEASRVRELKAQGVRPSDIAKALKIGRASVYRVLGQRADKEAAP
jgi:Resolvase, N terminal domain/Helix-turn-helix domain of resolvase